MNNEYSNSRHRVFIAHVAIPADVNRADYIRTALRTNTVCVWTPNGEFIKNCPVVYSFIGINDGFIHALQFPGAPDILGSQVVCLTVPDSDIPLIIGCLTKGRSYTQLEEEYQMKIFRTSDTGSYIIEGSGLHGILSLLVNGNDDEGGKIMLSANNKVNTGEIRLASDTITLEAKNTVSILANQIVEIIARNMATSTSISTIRMEVEQLILDADKINLGQDASHPVPHGDTLQQQLNVELARLNALIQSIAAAVVVPGDGGAALKAAMQAATQTLQAADYSNINSEKSFTE